MARAGYRRQALRCPGCGDTMTERSTDVAHVDVCDSCAGIWIDWFDGGLHAVAVSAAPLPVGSRATQQGDGTCPLCRQQLVIEPMPDTQGGSVHRCGACHGAWVSREHFDQLVLNEPADSTPLDEASGWSWIGQKLQRWFGW